MRDTPALFFGLLTFFFMLRSIQEQRMINWLLTAFFLGITVMIRLEYIELLIVIPIFIILSSILEKKEKRKSIKKYLLGYLLIILAFVITAYSINEYLYISKGINLKIFNFSTYSGYITSHITNNSVQFYIKFLSINNLANFVSAIFFFILHISLILCIISLIKNWKNIIHKRNYTLLAATLFVTLSVRYIIFNAWEILIGRYCLLMIVIISIFAGDALYCISKFINKLINIKKENCNM